MEQTYVEITPESFLEATGVARSGGTAVEVRNAARITISATPGTQFHLAEPRPLAWGYFDDRAADSAALPGRNPRLISECGADVIIDALAGNHAAFLDLEEFLAALA